jgi:hypothetical protein
VLLKRPCSNQLVHLVRFVEAAQITQTVAARGPALSVGEIMDGMRIELLVVHACPHEAKAADVLATALQDIGLGSVGFKRVFVDSQQDAERRHFLGSPTICLDRADVFPEPDATAGLACRIYPNGAGVPTVRDLRQALNRAAALSERDARP